MRAKMSETAVRFLIEKYKIDESKARAFITIYKAITDQPELVGIPGQLTEEELLLLQQQQQQQQTQLPTQPTTVRVPQAFGAGGTGGTGEVPERGRSPNPVNPWWYAIGAWNFVTDPIWIYMFLKTSSGQAVGPLTRGIAGISPPGLFQRATGGITTRTPTSFRGAPVSIGTSRISPGTVQPGLWSRITSRLTPTGRPAIPRTPATRTTPLSTRASGLAGGLFSGLAAAGTISTFENIARLTGATGEYVGGTPVPEPRPFQWAPGTEQGGATGKCAEGMGYYPGWSHPRYRTTIKPGCYTTSQLATIRRSVSRAEEASENVIYGHG